VYEVDGVVVAMIHVITEPRKKTRMKVAKIGNDFSKDKFNVSVLHAGKRMDHEFANSLSGTVQLIEWLKQTGAKRFEMAFEPTGRYHESVCEYLWGQGFRLFQINPEVMSKYAASLDTRTKSDSQDAYALAKFVQERSEDLDEWGPKTDGQKEMRDVQLRMRSLVKRTTALQNQLQCGLTSRLIKADIEDELCRLEEKKKQMLEYATTLINHDPQMRKDCELLDSIIGIGWQSAVFLICLVDFRKFDTSRKLACFLGLTIKKRESGSSVKGKERISKKGRTELRSGLFCPVWASVIHNPILRTHYERLVGSGKPKRVAEVACLRKLVAIAWSIIKNQRPFDVDYMNQHTPI
jgi:transposase